MKTLFWTVLALALVVFYLPKELAYRRKKKDERETESSWPLRNLPHGEIRAAFRFSGTRAEDSGMGVVLTGASGKILRGVVSALQQNIAVSFP